MPTIRFPWVPGLSVPGLNITKQDDSGVTASSDSCTEFSPGIYDAVFAAITPGDYFIVPTSSTVEQDGIGTVFGVLNTGATFLETDLLAPGTVSISSEDIENIAAQTVAGLQSIPGFTIEVVSPTDSDGEMTVRQGDAYLVVNDRHQRIALSGSLPALESACTLRVFFGGSVTSYTGDIVVNSGTSYTLRFPFTGAETAAMPVGTFTYEVEVTYDGTTNKWTPSTGNFIVQPQLAA